MRYKSRIKMFFFLVLYAFLGRGENQITYSGWGERMERTNSRNKPSFMNDNRDQRFNVIVEVQKELNITHPLNDLGNGSLTSVQIMWSWKL